MMQSEEIAQRLRERAEVWRRYFPPPPQRTVEVSVASIQAAATECDEAADEIERLRAEVRRFQRIIIDASEATADCEDLCGVLCAGPCQGIGLPGSVTPPEDDGLPNQEAANHGTVDE